MHTHALLPRPRLIATGGPVTRAIDIMRRDHADERQRLADLRRSIAERISADLTLIENLDRVASQLGEDAR